MTDSSQSVTDERFQRILAECLEAIERGETLDRARLTEEHPEHAVSICEFLDNNDFVGRAIDGIRKRESEPVVDSAFALTLDSQAANPTTRFEVGDSLRYVGEYEIIDEIARGGMGIVFKARQAALNREVALKMILAGRLASQADVDRFHREARAAAGLKHPNIVGVHEVGQHEGHHYFTMDFVDGRSLASIISESTLPARRAAALIQTIALAIEYAHQNGVLHRDLKPANVLIDGQGQPHITDFGLAKSLVDGETVHELTATGQILGTPSYMSPEQASAKHQIVSVASDVYSLGAILYACLSGRGPFVADSPVDTLLRVMHEEPVSPRLLNPAVPKDLETICLKCLNKEPHRRYGRAQLLADDLGRFLEGRPVMARPVSVASKLVRWAKRNRLIAALLALSVLLLAGGTAVSTYFAIEANERAEAEGAERRRADHTVDLLRLANKETKLALGRETGARSEMQAERDEAQRQRDRVEALLYATHLKAAKVDLNAGRLKEARTHLDSCGANIRGWEHDHLSAVITNRENAESPEPLSPNPLIRQLPESVRNANVTAVAPDGKHVVVTGKGHSTSGLTTIPIVDLSSGEVVGTLAGHEARASSAAWRPDGKRIVTGTHDGSIRVWDAENYEELFVLPSHRSKISSLAFSPDGKMIISGSGDMKFPPDLNQSGQVMAYDAEAGTLLWELKGHRGVITCAEFSPDGRWIATGGFGNDMSDAGEVRLWNAETGEPIFSIDGPEIAVTSVAFSPDSSRLAVAGGLGVGEQDAVIVDVSSGETVFRLPDHRRILLSVAFSPDGRRIATMGGASATFEIRHVKLWDAATGIELLQLEADAMLHRVIWENSSDRILGIGRANGGAAVVTWKAEQQAVLPKMIIHRGTASAASSLTFTPNGKQIISGGQFQNVRVWDVNSGEELQTLTRHSKPILSVDVSGDGNRIASASFDDLKVWDQKLKREVLSIDSIGDETNFYAVACSPNGHRFAIAASKGRVRVWAVTDNFRGELSTPTGHQGTVRDVAFSPDGKRVATAGSDKTARVWNAETGEEISSFTGHPRDVTCVAFSPDGKRVVSGSFDKTLKIWNADKANFLTTLEGHQISVLCVAFSPDGRRIVSGSADKTIKVWDAETGEVLATLTGHNAYVRNVAFSPDGLLIASSAGVEDMTIRIWPNPAP